jgi:outer membrane protein assembly factor BamD (BamD/ComL family)
MIESLRREQALGSYTIAKFYEKRGRIGGALVYYNDVLLKDRNSPYAAEAQERINALKQRVVGDSKSTAEKKEQP